MVKINEILEKIEKIESLQEKIKFVELMIENLEHKEKDKELRKKLRDLVSSLEELEEKKDNGFLDRENINVSVEPVKQEKNLENEVSKEPVTREEKTEERKYVKTPLYQDQQKYTTGRVDSSLLYKIEQGLERKNLIPEDRIFKSSDLKDIKMYMQNMGLTRNEISRFTKEITGFDLENYETKDIKGTKDIRMFKNYEV